jgi:hypothetical protein
MASHEPLKIKIQIYESSSEENKFPVARNFAKILNSFKLQRFDNISDEMPSIILEDT